MRLGTGPRLLSRPGLRTYDARLPFETRHVSVSLVYVRDLLAEATRMDIRFYRMAAPVVPVVNAVDLDPFRRQLDGCLALAEMVGAEAQSMGMRLTVHPTLDIQLGSGEEAIVRRSAALASAWEALFAAMGLGSEARVVVHRGGSGPQADAAFVANALALPPAVRGRLAIENDERQCSLDAALWLSRQTGIPVVWDYLHWRCAGRRGRSPGDCYAAAAATWPQGVPAKVHFSSPRTAAEHGRPPQARAHADYLDPFAFLDFAGGIGDACDVMLEAGAKDLALLKLRQDLAAIGADALGHPGGTSLAAAG